MNEMVDYADSESSPVPEVVMGGASKRGVMGMELSSGAGCSKPNGESSSQSRLKPYFLGMGFSSTLVDKVLQDHGEENADSLLDTFFAYSADKRSSRESSDSLDDILDDRKDGSGSAEFATDCPKLKAVRNASSESSDSLDYLFGDCKDEGSSAKFHTNASELEELDEDVEIFCHCCHEATVNELVDFIAAAQVAQSSGVDINDQNHADNGKKEDDSTETLFWTMDVTLRLLDMGFSEDEISSAVEKYGAEVPVEELADSIFASRIADTSSEKNKEPPALHRMNHSQGENYTTLKSPKEEYGIRRSFDTLIAETEASSSKPFLRAEDIDFDGELEWKKVKKPKLEFEDYSDAFLDISSREAKAFEPKITNLSMSLPHRGVHKLEESPLDRMKIPQQPESNFCRGLRDKVADRPFFFYGNVLDVSHETWRKLSQFLYTIDPEFVHTGFFSALSRKEGYIHNLPTDDRTHIHPRSPMAIEDAVPHTKKWWPSWDTRKQLSCINSETKGIPQLCERLGKILSDSQGIISKEQQADILHHCKILNLMWVGQYRLSPIEPEQVERILGYPLQHTQLVGADPIERLRLLKYSFQTDTLGYHLSVLKWLFPDGLNVLSLFSGIGGAEVALHRLGLRLKGVVSMELCETNRRILRKWWQGSGQTGELVQIEDINKLTSNKLKSLINDFGGFDLVICQNPFTNIPGSSKVALDGGNPAGFNVLLGPVTFIISLWKL
ncbi:hypothetical protein IFM89_020933 [Coptis chinensis]|uniref:SAM-dependent MTase DRM-type domain-containing protein n=1 Tax=Coptis chinensis TaxID=261450 RepID=A0A835IPI2_9MAGN|nr:hypothetical protein IFM89_020933 [Coptis chinensis]